jgi:hypothetical protein
MMKERAQKLISPQALPPSTRTTLSEREYILNNFYHVLCDKSISSLPNITTSDHFQDGSAISPVNYFSSQFHLDLGAGMIR